MTISECVINWLKRFETEGKLKEIDTDLLMAATASYALTKTPEKNVKSFLSGKKIYSEYFQFAARLDSNTNTERIDNQAWFEYLTDWIEQMNQEKDFPILPEGHECVGISVTSPFYMGQSENNSAVYQLTIEVKYEKER